MSSEKTEYRSLGHITKIEENKDGKGYSLTIVCDSTYFNHSTHLGRIRLIQEG